MPKEKRINTGLKHRHAPLGQVIQDDENRDKYATQSTRIKQKHVKSFYSNRNAMGGDHNDDEDDNEEDRHLLDEKTSSKILELSREQMLEVEMEEQRAAQLEQQQQQQQRQRRDREKGVSWRDGRNSGSGGTHDGHDDEDEDGSDDGLGLAEGEEDELIEYDAGYVSLAKNVSGLSVEEQAIVSSMMGESTEKRRTLADIILDKIQEKEEQMQSLSNNNGMQQDDTPEGYTDLPEKVVQVYTEIGQILSRYTAGKLPKAFKVIPSLANWEEVLYVTRPDLWSPQAMFAATRIFASNLNPKMAQRFFNLVLLDAVRADIVNNHKLNYHYYMALKKSLYKPAAFFKGVLLPLCIEDCTLREAAIVSSILARVSIPVHHSAVAIHKLAQLPYSGAASIFLKTLLDKKYSLPAPVIGTMIRHFVKSGKNESGSLPVLWHQCFLVFVQRYHKEVKDSDKEALKVVLKENYHHKITPEIRRELFGAKAWKEEREKAMAKTREGEGGMELS